MEKSSPFSKNILNGKVALVTGGGSGIGYEVARQLGLHGANLVLMGRRLANLQNSAEVLRSENIKVEIAQGEVRSSHDAERTVDIALSTFGRLDILVNGAAGNFLAPAETLTPKGFKTVLEIDAVGTFNMSHAAFSALRRGGKCYLEAKSEGGVIINISATLHYGATWFQAHASAAKAAIDSLTRSLCLEWGPEYGIRINGIAPGPIAQTPGLEKLVQNNKRSTDIPLGRLGTTWDIAMAALFLVSNAGSWISGETLVVDGGAWLSKPQVLSRDEAVKFSRTMEAKRWEPGVMGNPASKL